MIKWLAKNIEANWYRSFWANVWLLPLSAVFYILSHMRRLYILNVKAPEKRSSVPVVVIGNITVGGTGKTPLTCFLVEALKQKDVRIGVISRGYGSNAPSYPYLVGHEDSSLIAGDEPKLLQQRLGCPVIIGADRNASIDLMISTQNVDLILCDDGLQHYQMYRDYELVLLDAKRQLGNGWLLPVGPLREGRWRLSSVDCVIENGNSQSMTIKPESWVNVSTGEVRGLNSFSYGNDENLELKAICGIGNPQRFWDSLQSLGVVSSNKAFPDHYQFSADDIPAHDTVLMTEKDAVKCQGLTNPDMWYLKVSAQLAESVEESLVADLVSLARLK